jgi:hypothetical protein
MNQYQYISAVMSNVHESIESWTRDLLRHAGIETIEVYGQFPPEGSIASHIVVFPYRLGGADTQIAAPYTEINLMGMRAGSSQPGMHPMWGQLGKAFTRCIYEKYPKVSKGPHTGKPHPSPPVKALAKPLRDWYKVQGDDASSASWVTLLGKTPHARLPSLVWVPGASLKMDYLVVVGEGARGTSEREAPVAIQALSVLAAGMQLSRRLNVRIPPPPFDRSIIPYAKAVAEVLDDGSLDGNLAELDNMDDDLFLQITLIPGNSLTNSDFTGLMQALQRPLQPTLHLSVSLSVGGTPKFSPGVNASVNSEQKARRPQGRG